MKRKSLIIILLIASGIAQAQIIDIPDPNFKNALLTSGVVKDGDNNNIILDSNNDNEIQESEALQAAWLDISNLNITSLDGIEYFVNLEFINCTACPITELDLSAAPNLTSFIVNDCTALTYINIKNSTILSSPELVEVNNATALGFVCVDEGEAAVLVPYFPMLYISTYCSFTPGGDYNTITGTLTFDLDDNGCDTTDPVNSFVKLNITNGTESETVFTNTLGNYNFYTEAGEFTITPMFENNYFLASPGYALVNFPIVDNSVATENFCISASSIYNDIEVVMVPIGQAQPGINANYKIVYKNKGNTVLSGGVSCGWDDELLGYVNISPMADIIGTGTYTWYFSNLQPFESREILMTLNVNSTTDTPSVNIGDVLPFTADVTITGVDEIPSDNNFLFDQVVVGAYPSNSIICIEGDTESTENIGEYLHYVVNFENTGNTEANAVVIRHELDETKFDIASLQLLNSSHEVMARVEGSSIEFIFENANLSVADHGNILFKIKSRSNLMANDMVTNSANIYFDYNTPVQTNNANTVFATLSTGDFELDNSVSLYPNPSKDIITITANTAIMSVQLYDVQGRLVQVNTGNEAKEQLDISAQPSGLYFVKITTEDGVKVTKLVKE
ncbi:T9SS C-terminal target domain-containing protein [Flavobacterium arcticum]|uniref:T9SS C-terminal target domain-containing protein n=1 Tax=Flavobacterium arcticum TaxID=1784713 RepID=A0A345H9C0_9FLAO|nr:T9SS type A sorting domain-containing protein [Flavobacterium arcticum]AXG73180.1 T9SS C-terminal target domain-containing protein [Flavobacterium arcticum]KAF2512972.1 T9SS type A sorting domain-containing protein [Flavobacterium arcticum]